MDERDELHKTVLAEEAVSALNIQSEGFYIDATFGRGGHSRAILSELGVEGHLLALDRDPEAIEAAQQLATRTTTGVIARQMGTYGYQTLDSDCHSI